jgi:hypothetical protein
LDSNRTVLLKVASYADEDQVEAVADIAKARAEKAQASGSLPVKSLRNLENLAAGELARWIKLTTPNDRTRVIRMLRECAANPAGMAKGTRHRATRLAEALFDGQAEALVQKVISMALSGDQTALRLALERLCPPRRDRPVAIDMPRIERPADLVAAASSITTATVTGQITPQEGSDLVRLVEGTARAIEVHELAERIDRLEAQMASKGHQ